MKKLFYIKTYGCQMNFYDSEKIQDLLKPMGYILSKEPENCDLAILNTCHIREKASEKMYSDIGRLSKYKKNKKLAGENMIIAICGCVAQAEGKEIIKRNKDVDIVLGPHNYHKLTSILSKKFTRPVIKNEFDVEEKFNSFPKPSFSGVTAYVSIQEGCDKFCTFCVVPYTRGAEYSRNVLDIFGEVKNLVSLGVKEITLLGQNVNAYNGKFDFQNPKNLYSLAKLCSFLSEIKGLERIRYITSHPADMTDELILEHQNNSKLMPYLHLPIQSGSNKILKEMNRRYTKEVYLKIVEKLRSKIPNIALTSDFIVGFPGENKSDFDDTMDIVKSVKFAGSYSFKYSPRPGTPAFLKKFDLEDNIINDRLNILQKELNLQQKQFNEKCIGLDMEVLVEKIGKKRNQFVGRSEYLQPVHIISREDLIGKLVKVKIKSLTSFSLHGKLS